MRIAGFLEVAPGVFQWSVRQADRGIDFNGLFVVAAGGNVVVDPVELSVAQMDAIWERGGVGHVVLTNRHHGRRTAELVQRTDALVHAHDADAAALGVAVDETFRGGDLLPGGLLAIEVPHSKSPGETALLLPRDGGTLVVGDAVIGDPPGRLRMLPDEKFADPAAARRGLAVLLDHAWTRMAVGDGTNPEEPRRALEALIAGPAHGLRIVTP